MTKLTLAYLRRLADFKRWFSKLGSETVEFLEHAGAISILFWRLLAAVFSTRLRWGATIEQAYKIGVA